MIFLLNLSKEQIEFLRSEFGIEKTDLQNMTTEKWDEIRFKAFEIEADLIPDKKDAVPSHRCALATSIIDVVADFN